VVRRMRRSGSASLRRPRRRLEWADFVGEGSTAAGAMSQTNMLGGYETAFGADASGCTVTRILLEAYVAPAATPSADVRLQFGILHASINQTGVNVRTMPYEDWMLHAYANCWLGSANMSATTYQRFFDLRAKRKLDELSSTLWICLQNPGGVTAFHAFHARILLALP